MANKRRNKKPVIFILVLILVTLFIAPFGIFYHIKVYSLSFFSFIIHKSGLASSYTVENKILKEDNKRLIAAVKEKEAEIHALKEMLKQFESIKKNLILKDKKVVPAQVIFYEHSPAKSRLMINKGKKDGIYKNAIVLYGDYLLGYIINVSAFASEVLLLNDIHSSFSVFVGEKRLAGIINGRGKGYALEVDFIDNQPENRVQKGDVVVSSGYLSEVPRFILIGEIVNDPERETKDYDSYMCIKVKPYVNTLALKSVFVLIGKREAPVKKGIK